MKYNSKQPLIRPSNSPEKKLVLGIEHKLLKLQKEMSVINSYIKTSPYGRMLSERRGLNFLKGREFIFLIIMSYLTIFTMSCLEYILEISTKSRLRSSLLELIPVVIVGIIGNALYNVILDLCVGRAERIAYSQAGGVTVLNRDRSLYQLYICKNNLHYTYYQELLRIMLHPTSQTSILTKIQSQLDFVLYDKARNNYSKVLLAIFCYSKEAVSGWLGDKREVFITPQKTIMLAVSGFLLMVILGDPYWLRSGIQRSIMGLTRCLSGIMDCFVTVCCRKTRTKWQEQDQHTAGYSGNGTLALVSVRTRPSGAASVEEHDSAAHHQTITKQGVSLSLIEHGFELIHSKQTHSAGALVTRQSSHNGFASPLASV